MHQVEPARQGERIIDPDQVCDAIAVLADRQAVQRSAALLDALGDPHLELDVMLRRAAANVRLILLWTWI